MKLHTRGIITWFTLISCLLLLSACDLFGGSAAKPTPTTAPTSAPAVSLTTYKGDGYSISYPQGWTVKENDQAVTGTGKAVTFTNSSSTASFTIDTIPNPNGIVATSFVIDASVRAFKNNAKNYQDVNMPQKTTIGGQSWDQRAATADLKVQGITVNTEEVGVATNHPTNSLDTKLYGIAYVTATMLFEGMNSTAFQPMLQSFKFS